VAIEWVFGSHFLYEREESADRVGFPSTFTGIVMLTLALEIFESFLGKYISEISKVYAESFCL